MSLPLRISRGRTPSPSHPNLKFKASTPCFSAVPETSAPCLRCLWTSQLHLREGTPPSPATCCRHPFPVDMASQSLEDGSDCTCTRARAFQNFAAGLPMFSPSVWGSLSFLRSSDREGSRVVVKKLSHRPVPFGSGGVRVTFQLPYDSTTHITAILVRVYKYMRSVTFMTLGNKGHGSGPCVHTLRKEIGAEGRFSGGA